MPFSLIPKLILPSLTDLTPELLAARGVRFLMLDFDNTIVPYTTNEPAEAMTAWLRRMQASEIRLCVVSNSRKPRVVEFCKKYGLDCITPSFFRAAYRGGQLKDTVVLSETCEFLGVSGSLDTSMADALLAGGAKAVAGYVNNVYTVYSRSMLWDTVNHLILGQTLQESVQHSMDTYGADDLVWYNAQGGKRPHAAAAYPLLFGDVGVRLIEPNAAPVPQDVQQAA